MNSAPLNAVCPLCRRDMSQNASANASRLCDECQSIIETIRPRAPKTSPLAGGPEFRRDLSLEAPLEAETPASAFQPAAGPANAGPQGALQGRPLREYEAAAMGCEDSGQQSGGLGEWPLVVNDDRDRGRSRVLVGVLGVALLLGAAAGLFVANRYFGAGHSSAGAAETRQVNSQPRPANAGLDKPVQAASLSSAAQSEGGKSTLGAASRPNQGPAQATQPPVEQPGRVTGPAANEAGGGKLTSFQIASFPSEPAAKDFCDRLIRAGLPAYTVRAEIPRRGKWFRVRAGKFGSPQESEQTAIAWRRLAAAAGINLQLVQCDYER